MDAAMRKLYDAERYKVRKAAREIAQGGQRRQGRPVRRSDGTVYATAVEAAQAFGLKDGSHILSVCAGRQRTAGGYEWRYLEDWEARALGMGEIKPGQAKQASDYADSKVYRETMARLWQGTCRQCRYYIKVGGREQCQRSVRVMDTDGTATCPRWEHVPTATDELQARLLEQAQELKAKQIEAARAELERRRQAKEAERAFKWQFRGQVLGMQVDYFVQAICRRYGIEDRRDDR